MLHSPHPSLFEDSHQPANTGAAQDGFSSAPSQFDEWKRALQSWVHKPWISDKQMNALNGPSLYPLLDLSRVCVEETVSIQTKHDYLNFLGPIKLGRKDIRTPAGK